jgi:hypothetical protein
MYGHDIARMRGRDLPDSDPTTANANRWGEYGDYGKQKWKGAITFTS